MQPCRLSFDIPPEVATRHTRDALARHISKLQDLVLILLNQMDDFNASPMLLEVLSN